MERLWAPWRLAYVAGAKPATGEEPCFICRGLAQTDDRTNLIVRRQPSSVVILNRFPYNNGHLLIAPNEHKARLQDLSAPVHAEIQETRSARCSTSTIGSSIRTATMSG